MKVVLRASIAMMTVLLIAPTGILHAAGLSGRNVGHDEALRLRQAGTIVPFAVILDSVLRQYRGGRLLQTELQRDGEVLIYDVELLTVHGRVRTLHIDARSGRVLSDQ